jgi:hypothetical protein
MERIELYDLYLIHFIHDEPQVHDSKRDERKRDDAGAAGTDN